MSPRRIGSAVGLVFVVAALVVGVLPAGATENQRGGIVPLPADIGCVQGTNVNGCGASHGGNYPRTLMVSPDGRNVYVTDADTSSLLVLDRNPSTGSITQKPGADGCFQTSGVTCIVVANLQLPYGVVVAPDGEHVYVADGNGVSIFMRDSTTGSLTYMSCWNTSGTNGCFTSRATVTAVGIAMDASGTHLYVASFNSNAVAIFGVLASGSLTQAGGVAGCVSANGTDNTGVAGTCTDGPALNGPQRVAVSPDGASVYVTSINGGSLQAFDRNGTTGRLTPSSGGCFGNGGTDGCTAHPRLAYADSVAAWPKRNFVLVVSLTSVEVFRRTATGGLAFVSCVNDDGAGVCSDGRGLDQPQSVAVSADGASAYVVSYGSGSVTAFDLGIDGTITQKKGVRGCVAATAIGGCLELATMTGPRGVAVSPDRTEVFVAATDAGAIVGFRRTAYCPGYATSTRNQVIGTSGNDVLVGTSAGDVVCGLAGNDTLKGRGGRDVLLGAGGKDALYGGAGDDRLVGGAASDFCDGGLGKDKLVSCERLP